jgi:signal transduction histidine kinase
MKDVTETLLWLGRDETTARNTTPVRVDQVIAELVDGLRYLTQGRPVELDLDLEVATLELPEAPTRIVLGNLLRNALQHTASGHIEVRQRGGEISIINTQNDSVESNEIGFGLGLKLTERFTQKLGWHYINQPLSNGRHVEIHLRKPEMQEMHEEEKTLTGR